MKLPRRAFLRLAAGAAALPALPRVAQAETYPSRPVHIIVGFAAGSASDIVTRLIGQSLSERLGQPFVIENRGGAGGTLGAEAVAHASPDGYTLLASGSQDAVTATLYDKLSYQFSPRYRAGRQHRQRPSCSGGQSIIPSQNCSGIHRLCQSQSGQNQIWIGRHRQRGTYGARTVQGHGKSQHGTRALSWSGACAERSARRSIAVGILNHAAGDRAYQSRQAACLSGYVESALRSIAGPSDRWRFLARI